MFLFYQICKRKRDNCFIFDMSPFILMLMTWAKAHLEGFLKCSEQYCIQFFETMYRFSVIESWMLCWYCIYKNVKKNILFFISFVSVSNSFVIKMYGFRVISEKLWLLTYRNLFRKIFCLKFFSFSRHYCVSQNSLPTRRGNIHP